MLSSLMRSGGNPPRKANGKIDWSPKKHHGFTLVIVLLGFLLPPLAVAARFGIGKDFFINVVLTLCGYFPGHGHNFFVQNIRDNTHRNRTPKWAVRYGLVDQSAVKRKQANRAHWVGRYNDQTAERTMYDEDGNQVRYEHGHRFEDGDDTRAPTRPLQDSELTERDEFYGQQGQSASSDPYSLRRTTSAHSSISSNAPGGLGERKAARNKSKSRAFLGRKKADRHAKSGEVMGDPDYVDPSRARKDGRGYHGDGFGDSRGSFNSSFSDERGGAGAGAGATHGTGYDFDDLDGPEDPDSRYRPGGAASSGQSGSRNQSSSGYAGARAGAAGREYSGSSGASATQGRATANDGLDHTF